MRHGEHGTLGDPDSVLGSAGSLSRQLLYYLFLFLRRPCLTARTSSYRSYCYLDFLNIAPRVVVDLYAYLVHTPWKNM